MDSLIVAAFALGIIGRAFPALGDWNLVWSDEFNGTSINQRVWGFDIGTGSNGWGNRELEYYTTFSRNVYVSDGLLHIVALQESYQGQEYTSARLKSQGLFYQKYGRIEFRARLPSGVGFWPALWMMGANFDTVGWPACGEIDVMENKGSNLGVVQGTIHYGTATNHSQATQLYTLPSGGSVTNFHIYRLEWTTNSISWAVDGHIYETQTNWSSSTGPYPAPFNQPFFFVMNLAVGGDYLLNPSTTTINANSTFPGVMDVDYVRVYNQTAPLQISVVRTNGGVKLTWPTNIVCHLQTQTTGSGSGIGTNWVDVTGSANPFVISPNVSNYFYRLASP